MINWIAALQQLSSLQRMKEGGITTVRVGSERCSWRVAARFDDEEIEQLRQRCGELGMRWELVVNRPIEEEDLPWLDKLMSQLRLWRPDGIVFHDPAVLLSARQAGLDSELIFVSDTLMTNAWDVRRMREAGCDRVALSTEITLQEIMDIAAQNDAGHLELQVHGAQVCAVSRRPLISSYLQLRGRTLTDLHQRRDLRIVEQTRQEAMPILEEEEGTAVYAPWILNSLPQITSIAQAGFGHLFLEGIFGSDQEVLLARAAMAEVLAGAEAQTVLCRLREKTGLPYGSGYYDRKTSLTKEDGR